MAFPPLLHSYLSLNPELFDRSEVALHCHVLGLKLECASLYWHLTGYWAVTIIIIIIIIMLDLVYFCFVFSFYDLMCVLYFFVHCGFTFGLYIVDISRK
jgi:hypothetical protein